MSIVDLMNHRLESPVWSVSSFNMLKGYREIKSTRIRFNWKVTSADNIKVQMEATSGGGKT